jgi:hypothetical protein
MPACSLDESASMQPSPLWRCEFMYAAGQIPVLAGNRYEGYRVIDRR